MAMICIWHPEENDKGVRLKEIKDLRSGAEISQYIMERVNVGHASILLDQLEPRSAYLSWWPQQAGTKTPTYQQDVTLEGRKPHVLISFDGLDEAEILDWWGGLLARRSGDRGSYHFKTTNCSTIVAAALDAGGASDVTPMPHYEVWTPTRVEMWASTFVEKKPGPTNGIFRHEGIGDLISSALRHSVSAVGAAMIREFW